MPAAGCGVAGGSGAAVQIDRAPLGAGMPLQRELELLKEREPAFVHVVVDALPAPVGDRRGADDADDGLRAVRFERETIGHAAAVADGVSGLVGLGVLEEHHVDVFGEPGIVPAEPAAHLRGFAQGLPDGLNGCGDEDFDEYAIGHG